VTTTEPGLSRPQRLYRCLNRPADIAALAVFRILFGALMCVGTIRFMANGWVELFFVETEFHFKYWGFGWVEVPGPLGLYLLYGGIALTAALVALGAFYRVAIVAFWCLFTYAELMDVTYYLNHYYFVSLLALILCFLSPHRAWSVDAWRKRSLGATQLPAWQTYWLRFQVGLLYFYAGVAKLEPDWLLNAQPLNIWLPPLGGMPLLGPLLEQTWVHFAFSWFAFLFDTSIVAFLLWRRTRLAAFGVVLVFHLFTHLFFDIGLFPLIMVFAALVFFDSGWPRRWIAVWHARRGRAGPAAARALPVAAPFAAGRWRPASAVFALVLALFCAFQFALPLRHWIYPGSVLWNEQGMRFSWRVMLREKSGSLQYRVVDRDGRTHIVTPHEYLNELQYREMAGQPDLVLQLAHRVRDDFDALGAGPVQVYADSLVSLNGRPAESMIDPGVDLAAVEPGLGVAHWITESPRGPPRLQQPLRLSVSR